MSRNQTFFTFEVGDYGVRITPTRDVLIEGAKTKKELSRIVKAVKDDLDETVKSAIAALKKYT